MTARYRPRFFDVNAPASSVASTAKAFSCPSFRIAAIPTPMELWRYPAVLEKTSTRDSWLREATGTHTEASRSASEMNRCMGGPEAMVDDRQAPRQSAPPHARWTE